MRVILLLTLLTLTACQQPEPNGPDPLSNYQVSSQASTHPAAKKAAPLRTDIQSDEPSSEETLPATDAPRPAGDFIELSRGPCFGRCPVYTATLLATNQLELTQPQQPLQHTVSALSFVSAKALLLRLNFFQLQTHYDPSNAKLCPNYMTDHPSTRISARLDGRLHQVVHYHGCVGFTDEATLLQLEQQLETALKLPLAGTL